MASSDEMGAYYENHADPDDSSTWGEADTVVCPMSNPLDADVAVRLQGA